MLEYTGCNCDELFIADKVSITHDTTFPSQTHLKSDCSKALLSNPSRDNYTLLKQNWNRDMLCDMNIIEGELCGTEFYP